MSYVEHLLSENAPQTEQADPRQVPNSAGGWTFDVGHWGRLDRFLILGSSGNTYYASARKLTQENAACVLECLKEDGEKTVARIGEISRSGRAPKQEPAVFAVALALVHGDRATQIFASMAMLNVCRTGAQLFQLVETLNALRGWGRGIRRTVAGWYLHRSARELAYQLVKYQSRGAWSHRDVLKLCHPKRTTVLQEDLSPLLRWAVKAPQGARTVARGPKGDKRWEAAYPAPKGALPPIIEAFEELAREDTTLARAVELIAGNRLTHEMVPGRLKGHREVWEALLSSMPLGAILRNLGQLTARGILAEGSFWTAHVISALLDASAVKGARIHPIAVLSALKTYEQGRGDKGALTWTPVQGILTALDVAFYHAFGAIEPTGKHVLIGVDVSPSMDSGSIGGVSGLTPRMGAAALAMVFARREERCTIMGFSHRFVRIEVDPSTRLPEVMKRMRDIPMGGTDCSLPMRYAKAQGLDVDGFVVLTDNETHSGSTHPHIALLDYRNYAKKPAKLVTVGMTATSFSIADPKDAGSLDVVGFDSAAPALVADFFRSA